MKKTLTEMRAELTALTTKARDEHHRAYSKASCRVEQQYPNKTWYEQMDIVERDIEVQKTRARLMALCNACEIFKADMGE